MSLPGGKVHNKASQIHVHFIHGLAPLFVTHQSRMMRLLDVGISALGPLSHRQGKKMNIRFSKAEDKEFAENLTKKNMRTYYEKLSISWDSSLFDKSRNDFDNYEIVNDEHFVGVLRLWFADEALYIRDLQIKTDYQRKGIGTQAINEAVSIAKSRNFRKIRLRVFKINSAKLFYERRGFTTFKEDEHILSMELSIT